MFAMFSTPIRAIAFDLDGTLVDSLTDIAAAANAARAELGLAPLADSRVRSFIGDGSAMLMARTAQDDPHAQVDDSPLQIAARAHFNQHYARVVAEHTRPYPGAVEGLQALAALGLPLACVTNKPIAFTTPLLAALDLAQYFQLVLGGDSLAANIALIRNNARLAAAVISDPIKALVSYNHADAILRNPSKYFTLWIQLGISYPGDYLQAFIDQTKGYWFPAPAALRTNEGISPNEIGLSWPHLLRGQFPVKISEILLKLPDMLPVYGILWSIGAYFWASFSGSR